MTIKERIESLCDCDDRWERETVAQLTRLLALVEAAKAVDQESKSLYLTYMTAKLRDLGRALAALDAAGDLDKPQQPPLNINGGPLKPYVRQFIDGKDVTPFDSECEPQRPKAQQEETRD